MFAENFLPFARKTLIPENCIRDKKKARFLKRAFSYSVLNIGGENSVYSNIITHEFTESSKKNHKLFSCR